MTGAVVTSTAGVEPMSDETENAQLHEPEEELLSADDLITGDEADDTPVADDAAEPTEEVEEQPEGEEPTHPADGGEVETPTEEPPQDDLRQQEQAALDRLNRIGNAWENALNRYNNDPSEQNYRAVKKAEALSQEAKSELAMIRESDDMDIDPAKAIKQVAGEVESYQRKSGETQAQYDERIAHIERSQQEISHQLGWMKLEAENPHLKGTRDTLVAKAQQVAQAKAQKFPGQMTPEVWQYLCNEAWGGVVNEAIQSKPPTEAPKAEAKAPTPTPKPKATQPLKSKSGHSRKTDDADADLRSVMDTFVVDDS